MPFTVTDDALFPADTPTYRRLAGRDPDFEVTWEHGELSRYRGASPLPHGAPQ